MNKKRMIAVLVVASCAAFSAGAAGCTSGDGTGSGSGDGASAAITDYDEVSLIAFHEANGNDITSVTEVSVDACGECHGDEDEIAEATVGAVDLGDGTEANPHYNHMTNDLTCSDCHSLAEQSTLYCATCHTLVTLTDDTTGVWDVSE